MPPPLRSVAKIWTGQVRASASMYSLKLIAIEYASSPVEQPTTQIRTGSAALRSDVSRGNTFVLSSSKDSGSRKNDVTLIRMSWNSASISPGRRRMCSA
jgi:hypothetical protein